MQACHDLVRSEQRHKCTKEPAANTLSSLKYTGGEGALTIVSQMGANLG
jgi:hypothetical protein